MKVLVVEDAPEVVETIRLCVSIRWPGTTLLVTSKGKEVPGLVETESPDVVLLDLGLPDSDGLSVLEQVRSFSDVPVIVVTARGDETSRVKGLEMGADDYVVKPFSHTELLARLRAVLRRSHRPEMWAQGAVVSDPHFTVDLAARRVFVDETEVELTPTEWNFLAYLVRNEGKVIPHNVLAEKVWGSEDVDPAAIKMCVRRLRVKLHDDSAVPTLIRTHRGRGYSFVRRT